MEFHAFQPRAGVRPSPLSKARAAGTRKESMACAQLQALRVAVAIGIGELARGKQRNGTASFNEYDI